MRKYGNTDVEQAIRNLVDEAVRDSDETVTESRVEELVREVIDEDDIADEDRVKELAQAVVDDSIQQLQVPDDARIADIVREVVAEDGLTSREVVAEILANQIEKLLAARIEAEVRCQIQKYAVKVIGAVSQVLTEEPNGTN